MIGVAVAFVVLQAQAADSLHIRAERMSAAELVQVARTASGELRDAIGRALQRAFALEAAAPLVAAQRLAEAHASAWQDSFHVREVARFSKASADWRRRKLRADSLRRAGVAAFGHDALTDALDLWRESYRLATAIADTSAMAAALGNIGAWFDAGGSLDSATFYQQRARRLAARVGDVRVEANATGALAGLRATEGLLDEARTLLDRAVALRVRIGDDRGAAADHQTLGHIAWELGQLAEAAQHTEQALAMNRRSARHIPAATNLFNLAGIVRTQGDPARAATLYGEALSTYRSEGMTADAADALHGRALTEMDRGDYRAAQHTLREVIAAYSSTGLPAYEVAGRRDLATALYAAGDPQGAIDEIRRAAALADSTELDFESRGRLVLARADLAVQLNRFGEAERLYVDAARLFRSGGDEIGEADARQGHAVLLIERENWREADLVLSDAIRTFEALGNLRATAHSQLLRGVALHGAGNTDAARDELRNAALSFEEIGDGVAAAVALGELGRLEAREGHPLRADSLYELALARVETLAAPGVTWELHLGRALAARTRHALPEASAALREAVASIEQTATSLRLPERRTSFFADKWEVYAQLALTERRRGRIADAFEASERMRARELLELLQLGRIEVPVAAYADLALREQSLRRRIALLTGQLQPAAGTLLLRGPAQPAHAAATRETLARLQREYADLLLELRERGTSSAELVAAVPASWQEIARRLPADRAMIQYLASDSGVVAFIVTRDTLAALDLGIARDELARLVAFARAMVERGATARDTRWRAPMRRLFDHLIAPAFDTGLLAGVTHLIIVPHGELHYLPFAALPDRDGRFLIERVTLSVAPSGSVWLALERRKGADAVNGLIAFAPRREVLPGTGREVNALRQTMSGRTLVRAGPAASEAEFRAQAGRYSVLHLATSGVLNRHNPLFSFVELAPGDGEDGRLAVYEIFGLDLSAELVVLSACETGLGSGALSDVPPGDDWIGLTRAFLHAGAANVIATLWSVDDRATALLMEQFYERYAQDADPAAALAHAQRRLLRDPATAHPFYWAGATLAGRGR